MLLFSLYRHGGKTGVPLSHRLKEQALHRGTIVFYCGDDGTANALESTFDNRGPYRGKKGTLCESGRRLSMLAR